MNRLLSLLLLSLAPALSFAAGDHSSGHDMSGMEHGQMNHGASSPTGQAGDPAKVSRTVEITLDDAMRFNPSRITVKAGETIRFFVKNTGKLQHEMVLGTKDELKAHAEMMRKMPDMQHEDANMVRLAPGQRGGLVWQFDQAGQVDFACLVPGHMEAGMVGKVNVE